MRYDVSLIGLCILDVLGRPVTRIAMASYPSSTWKTMQSRMIEP